jgi:hypothetical protein
MVAAGASHCPHCTQEQPWSKDEKRAAAWRVVKIGAGVVIVLIVGAAILHADAEANETLRLCGLAEMAGSGQTVDDCVREISSNPLKRAFLQGQFAHVK